MQGFPTGGARIPFFFLKRFFFKLGDCKPKFLLLTKLNYRFLKLTSNSNHTKKIKVLIITLYSNCMHNFNEAFKLNTSFVVVLILTVELQKMLLPLPESKAFYTSCIF